MTALAAIKAALSDLGIPMAPDVYTGSSTKYITYNIADDHGADFGDDKPLRAVVSVQVHYCQPIGLSYNSIKKQIRNKLFAADFTFPEVTQLNDETTRHIIFECEYTEEI